MIIPNSVGRIDAITEAIRDGDRERAIELTDLENSRLLRKLSEVEREMAKVMTAVRETENFRNDLYDDEVWNKARRDCGWEG